MMTKLPATYLSARAALAKCVRIDECKAWKAKAEALRSYAVQMKDEKLINDAMRIKDRAIQRGGELLLAMKAARGGDRGGGRPTKDGNQKGGASPLVSRKAVAKEAGLSPDQAKTMVRVASVPKVQAEALIEGTPPATVKQLAEIGKKKVFVKPEPYREEWADWTIAVRHLAVLPGCGLDVLAVRMPVMFDDLRAECERARKNLELWGAALEAVSCQIEKET